jgi:hypothetical protein
VKTFPAFDPAVARCVAAGSRCGPGIFGDGPLRVRIGMPRGITGRMLRPQRGAESDGDVAPSINLAHLRRADRMGMLRHLQHSEFPLLFQNSPSLFQNSDFIIQNS